VKRRRALLENNPPRNSQLETHPPRWAEARCQKSCLHRMDRFPHAWKNSRIERPRSGILVVLTALIDPHDVCRLLLSPVDQLLYDSLPPYPDTALQCT